MVSVEPFMGWQMSAMKNDGCKFHPPSIHNRNIQKLMFLNKPGIPHQAPLCTDCSSSKRVLWFWNGHLEPKSKDHQESNGKEEKDLGLKTGLWACTQQSPERRLQRAVKGAGNTVSQFHDQNLSSSSSSQLNYFLKTLF